MRCLYCGSAITTGGCPKCQYDPPSCPQEFRRDAAVEVVRWMREMKVVHIARTTRGTTILQARDRSGRLMCGEGGDVIEAAARARAATEVAL